MMREIHTRVDPFLPPAYRTESLSRKVLAVLTNTQGVTCVLTGRGIRTTWATRSARYAARRSMSTKWLLTVDLPGRTRLGFVVGASEHEIESAVATVHSALRHPIMLRAAANAATGGLRRETPVILKLNDGTIAEGVVDLAFREDASKFDGWTVVDFKTDHEFEISSGRYISQVQIYARAVAAVTKEPARGVLLVV